MTRPPGIARWLLDLLLDPASAEAIAGDLEEEFHATAARRGLLAARWWFWRQTLTSIVSRRWAPHTTTHPAFGATSRRRHMIDDLVQDMCFTLRMFVRAPAFAAAAILTLALGIGAATAIATAAHRTLLRPLPYVHGDRLVLVGEADDNDPRAVGNLGYATISDWRARVRTFDELSAMRGWSPTVVAGEGAERLNGLRVNWNYFRMLGVRPALGRDFDIADDHPERLRVVILSHDLWRLRFGGRPDIVGSTIDFNGRPYEVIGVLPASFEPLVSERFYKPAEIWAPLGYDVTGDSSCRTCRHLRLVARLSSDATLDAGRAELTVIQEGIRREHPSDYGEAAPVARMLHEEITAGVRQPLRVLLVAVAFLLLVGCANVAGLLVARAIDRERELVVRAALGAGRGRIVRQLLTESLVLALTACALGMMVARWALAWLAREAPAAMPRLDQAAADPALFAIGAAVAAAALLAFGVLPAWTSARPDLQAVLSRTRHSPGRGPFRARELLIAGEVALALTLVAGAGLMFRTVDRLLHVDPGFDPRGVVSAGLLLVGPQWAEDEAVRMFQDEVLRRLQALPGVERAALSSQIPLGNNYDRRGFRIEGRVFASPGDVPSVERYGVTPDYFAVMRIPLLAGRLFTSTDRADGPLVLLVGETTARTHWPGENPVGTRVRIGGPNSPWRTVVGVVGDVRHYHLGDPPTTQLYLPQQQMTDSYLVLVARTSVDPSSVTAAIRREVAAIAPDVPTYDIATLDQRLSASVATRRFLMQLLSVFAAVTLAMVSVGLYGTVSQAVSARRRELGIRAALGATRADITRLVLFRGMRLVGFGIAAGLAGAAALGQLLSSQLYEIPPMDPVALAMAAGSLIFVALVSHAVPLRRARRVDPSSSLAPD